MRKPLVVIDTNLFISALILPNSRPGLLVNLWKKGKFELASSVPMIEELEVVLERPKYQDIYRIKPDEREKLLKLLKIRMKILTNVSKPKVVVRDVKDIIVLATAIDSLADYLITGDKDLLVLKDKKELGKLKILTATEFIDKVA